MEVDDKTESDANMDVDNVIPADSSVHSDQDMDTESHEKTAEEKADATEEKADAVECDLGCNKTGPVSTEIVSEESDKQEEEDTVITLNEELAVCGATEDPAVCGAKENPAVCGAAEDPAVCGATEDPPVCDATEESNEKTEGSSNSVDENPPENDKSEETSAPSAIVMPLIDHAEADNDLDALNVEEDNFGNLRIIGKRPAGTADASDPDDGAKLDSDDPEFSLNSSKSKKMLKKVGGSKTKKRSYGGGT